MDTCTYTVLVYRQSSTDIFIIKLHIEDRIDNNKGITFLYIAWARWLDSLGTFEATLLSKISENSLCVDAWNPRGTVFAFQTKKLEVFDIIFVNFSGLRCRRVLVSLHQSKMPLECVQFKSQKISPKI